jgi:hypothetical protein
MGEGYTLTPLDERRTVEVTVELSKWKEQLENLILRKTQEPIVLWESGGRFEEKLIAHARPDVEGAVITLKTSVESFNNDLLTIDELYELAKAGELTEQSELGEFIFKLQS